MSLICCNCSRVIARDEPFIPNGNGIYRHKFCNLKKLKDSIRFHKKKIDLYKPKKVIDNTNYDFGASLNNTKKI